jgi:hypothetical protein
VTSLYFVWWLDWVAISGLFSSTTDQGGNFVLLSSKIAGNPSKTVYPFTYIAVAFSFIAVAYIVYKAERRSGLKNLAWVIPIALLVANASSMGMVYIYEQVFISLYNVTYHSTYWWGIYWSWTQGGAPLTILDMSWVLATIPWWRRENLRMVLVATAIFLISMLVWFEMGFQIVESGNVYAYALNTISRISSQSILFFLVVPKSQLHRIARPRKEIQRLEMKVAKVLKLVK